ncbi:PASTA domain-containing protein [Leptospira jelokensis]|uniref:PASTA domain-containing protein n=1 Tax=Leptospira jelokensis TaxID=2484931 RepID=A0A4Z1A2S1_9LEPT|nr:PASTA domain-containing protein [Leptospira jelokensis]TGL74074.1 PASTA domain-containing protein [Leptospira jelokensis]TGL99546.1 PASTA domain-containing protein [Leptospira jelokensis]
MKEKFLKILPYSGYVLFVSLGLLVFFVAAFLVVVVRTKEEQKVMMPYVIGKNYIEVHNELQRLQLKVRLESERIPEKTDGIILSQSIDAGKEVEAGSKLYLTVNIGFDRVTIPDVKGQDLKRAKAILEKVLSGEVYVPLEIGGITYVPAVGDEPADTIIDQIPAPGKETHSGEKIYLLVTEASSDKKSNQSLKENSDETKLVGIPVPFAVDYLQRKKIPYSIKEATKPEFRSGHGLVASFALKPSGAEIAPYALKPSASLVHDYEFLEYEIDDDDVYSAKVSYTKPGEGVEIEKEILTSQSLKEDEILRLVVHRSTDTKVTLVGKETGVAKVWKLKGTY